MPSKTSIYLTLLIIIGLIYFSPIILTSKTIWVSEFDHYVPDLHIILQSWNKFQPPLWTDLQWNGFSHHAVMHNPTWYPPIIILGIFGFDAFSSAKILLISHFIMGMIFMFLLSRKILSENYSFLSALLFGFNPVVLQFVNSGWLTFVLGIAWLPLFFLFWFYNIIFWKRVIFSSIVLALILHSGGVFIVYYALMFLGLVEIFNIIKLNNHKISLDYKKILSLFALLFSFFSLTFFKIIPSMQFAKDTPRELFILKYADVLSSKVALIQLPEKTIGLSLIISIIAIFMYFLNKQWRSINFGLLIIIAISTGILSKAAYYFMPFFKMQSANLDRVLYPIIPFLIIISLFLISNHNFKSSKTPKFLISFVVFALLLNFEPLKTGDYKIEIDQNQALQYVAQDKSCCWRVWQFEEVGIDTTLNAYTTPLNIRTLFGFIGSAFYNVSYYDELRNAQSQGLDYFLKKYNIKYLLSKKELNPIPENYVLVKKFPESLTFRPHMSGQYVYIRTTNSSL